MDKRVGKEDKMTQMLIIIVYSSIIYLISIVVAELAPVCPLGAASAAC